MTLEGAVNIVFPPGMRTAFILQGNSNISCKQCQEFIRNCTYKLMTTDCQVETFTTDLEVTFLLCDIVLSLASLECTQT